jgi:AraC family transcriptional regulator of adaptative response/methylated-DNA-[protein]-cysteine methyltransferase
MEEAIMKQAMNDEQRWQAVLDRDREYDGAFVLGVKSTGIYCRPSCPARKPKRENVDFYASPADAVRAGFRPCKRCSPDTQAAEAALVEQLCGYLDAHYDEKPTLADLSAFASLSPFHLQRVFKRATGISPRQYADARRQEALRTGLKAGENVTRAIYDAGYGSSSQAYEGTPLGMTPAAYREGGAGMRIHYTVAPCALGYVLVGATERGVCSVCLGDSPESLREALQRDYPAADIAEDSGDLGEWTTALLQHLEGAMPHLELPLDLRATAFQRRVWEELRRIPYGETRSYSQIAAAVGQPQGARAVARACASNRVAVVVPCHRVVRENGDLGGYKWGLQRKERLLAREKQAARALAAEGAEA